MLIIERAEVLSRAESLGTGKSSNQMLSELTQDFKISRQYDIFLAHSYKDPDLICGVKLLLEDMGYSVYVDWIEDYRLVGNFVSPETVQRLKKRMNNCQAFFYITTSEKDAYQWLPWMCGFFEGQKGKVAILPVTDKPANKFNGQGYLGIYPYCSKMANLLIHTDPYNHKKRIPFKQWLSE